MDIHGQRVGPADAALLDSARGTTAKALAALDACVTRVSEQLAEAGEKYNDKLASHLAYLTERVTQVLGELRKLEAYERGIVPKMSPAERDALVLDYLRELPPERRAEILRFLADLDAAERSVL